MRLLYPGHLLSVQPIATGFGLSGPSRVEARFLLPVEGCLLGWGLSTASGSTSKCPALSPMRADRWPQLDGLTSAALAVPEAPS